MKNTIGTNKLLLCLLCGTISFLYVPAQQKMDYQQAMQKLKEAQKIMDSVKGLIPQLPKMPNVNLPPGVSMPTDSSVKAGLPNFDKMSSNLAQNVANLQNMQGQRKQQRQKALPPPNPANHVSALAAFTEHDIVLLVNQMLPAITHSLDSLGSFIKQRLDKTANDTTVNVAGSGMILLASDVPACLGEYLICKGVLRNPGNLWAINDLGIVLRNRHNYNQAIQCFTYACSYSDSLYIIKTNLAWASFYYGDFEGAKKYFNQALNITPGFNSALEGLALIAYQQGDVSALFTCLAKEVKGFGGGGPGPSNGFAAVCGGVAMDNDMNNMGQGQQTDPASDNTYDNSNGDDGNQDPPPTAETEPITYPSMGDMFANSVDDLMPLVQKTNAFYDRIKKATQESAAKVAEIQPTLSRLSPAPYMDDHGDRVLPYSYQKFYTLFHNVHEEFEKRASWTFKQYEDKMGPLLNAIVHADADMIKAYSQEISKCTDQACQNTVNCTWRTKMRGNKSADLAAISTVWTQYYQKMIDQVNWYISASSPFIKRVHKQDWNKYMNQIRIDDVHKKTLVMYAKWVQAQAGISGGVASFMALFQNLVCTTPLREMPSNGPDPKNVKLKKLNTYPEYCDNDATKEGFDVGALSYSRDCSQMTIKIGSDDMGAFYQRNFSKQAQEKNNTRVGVSLGFGYDQTIKAAGAGNSSASIKASVQAKVQAGYQFNDDGTTAKFADAEISAGIKGKVTTGNDDADKLLQTASFGHGFDVKIEVMSLKGMDGNYGNWSPTSVSGTKY